MIAFTFNEQTHLGWNVYNTEQLNLALIGIAFVVYVDQRGTHHFQDGPFPLHMVKMQKNASTKNPAGPILFAMKTTTATVLLFQTLEHHIVSDTGPIDLHLLDWNVQFFDREALREIVNILCKQPPAQLLPFQDLIFQLAKSTEEERLRLSNT